MTAPATMVKRRLTINFERSVKAGVPQVMEVAVSPLTDPSSPNGNATLVGGTQTQDVLLGNAKNPAYFDLVPTDSPDLTARLTYRIAWRERYMGQQFTQDFVMPDFDCEFDDLQNLGNLIGGTTYIQWTDRLRPGGVAGLNDSGQVIDSEGTPVTGAEEAAVVQGNLEAEVVLRQQGDQNLQANLTSFTTTQIDQVYRTTAANLAFEVTKLQGADLVEKTARINADNALAADITGLTQSTATAFSAVNEEIDAVHTALDGKADLVDGQIPSSQIPSIALGHAVTVADEAAMLALTPDDVQPGDMAVRPDGTFYLNQLPTSNIDNWVKLSDAASVSSVNGQAGEVHLGPADVGARALADPIPFNDVTGLGSAMSGKTNVGTTTALTNRVTAIETDATIVKTVLGVVPHAQHGNDVAFIDGSGHITNKAGQVINTGGGGGVLGIADVTGLQPALDAKLDKTDPSVTNARTPTAHAASHGTGQPDAITPASIGARGATDPVSQADVTGLAAIIANNNLTASSNHGNRILALESGGGSGGGTGSPVKSTWFDGPTPTTDFTTVILKSPFGKAGSDNHLYYDPAGAAEGESVYPHITPNGHLELRVRNESAPADPALAKQVDLDTANAQIATKASQASLDATNAAVALKASQSALDATNADVATRATSAALATTNGQVALKANQSALDTTNTNVGLKADKTTTDSLQTQVNAKADITALTATNNAVALKADQTALTATNAAVGTKADQTALTATNATVALKANQTDVTGLTTRVSAIETALPLKADLVGGVVPTSQLPALAYTTTVVVATKTAMLALSPTQVQPGDVCVITSGPDQGSYILNGTDPSNAVNWVTLATPGNIGSVTTVNGQPGPVVVLGASDVGARASNVNLNISEITNLQAQLDAKAATTALTTGLAGKTAPSDVQALITNASQNKLQVTLVATSAVPTLSGQQSIDGVLAPVGTPVLLTAQAASSANGSYLVASGAWTRVPDMQAGDYFVRGTIVTVSGGVTNHDTFWQQTSPSGIVGTNVNNWTKIMTAGVPPTYTASLGVQKVPISGGNDFRAQVVAGGGILAVAGGLQLDPTVAARKLAVDVPASGSNTVTITHNLNTTDLSASFRDKASGDATLLGWKPTGVNTISAEFDSPPAAGQWRVTCIG